MVKNISRIPCVWYLKFEAHLPNLILKKSTNPFSIVTAITWNRFKYLSNSRPKNTDDIKTNAFANVPIAFAKPIPMNGFKKKLRASNFPPQRSTRARRRMLPSGSARYQIFGSWSGVNIFAKTSHNEQRHRADRWLINVADRCALLCVCVCVFFAHNQTLYSTTPS